MGKQTKSRAKTRNGTDRPDWMPARTKREQDINRHLPREWLDEAQYGTGTPDDQPVYARALMLHREDWPRSCTGNGPLDELLTALWRD